jgi:hypothetical protein
MEKFLEGPVTEQVIQEYIEQEALAKHQVEATRYNLEAFKVVFPILECWDES